MSEISLTWLVMILNFLRRVWFPGCGLSTVLSSWSILLIRSGSERSSSLMGFLLPLAYDSTFQTRVELDTSCGALDRNNRFFSRPSGRRLSRKISSSFFKISWSYYTCYELTSLPFGWSWSRSGLRWLLGCWLTKFPVGILDLLLYSFDG